MSETSNVYDIDRFRERRDGSVVPYDGEQVDFHKSDLDPAEMARKAVSSVYGVQNEQLFTEAQESQEPTPVERVTVLSQYIVDTRNAYLRDAA